MIADAKIVLYGTVALTIVWLAFMATVAAIVIAAMITDSIFKRWVARRKTKCF
jgi:hypothetical protein